jgi:hypothetical protein
MTSRRAMVNSHVRSAASARNPSSAPQARAPAPHEGVLHHVVDLVVHAEPLHEPGDGRRVPRHERRGRPLVTLPPAADEGGVECRVVVRFGVGHPVAW